MLWWVVFFVYVILETRISTLNQGKKESLIKPILGLLSLPRNNQTKCCSVVDRWRCRYHFSLWRCVPYDGRTVLVLSMAYVMRDMHGLWASNRYKPSDPCGTRSPRVICFPHHGTPGNKFRNCNANYDILCEYSIGDFYLWLFLS